MGLKSLMRDPVSSAKNMLESGSTTDFQSVQPLVQFSVMSSQETTNKDMFSVNSTTQLKKVKPTKANLIKTIEQKPTHFTSKVQIKNLELARKLVADPKLA